MKINLNKRLPGIIIISVYAVCYLISYLTGIGCIWKYLFGIPCPGCGYTHSVISAFKLDFPTAFAYHPMFWSFPILVCLFVFEDRIETKKFNIAMIALLIGFLISWVVRLIV